MNNSKQDKRLRSLWYKKDIKEWIKFKEKIGRYKEGNSDNSESFLIDMSIWNTQFTHEETQLKIHKDWSPYCYNTLNVCKNNTHNKMCVDTVGWRCTYCDMVIGKHLFRIYKHKKPFTISGWDNFSGRPHYHYLKDT